MNANDALWVLVMSGEAERFHSDQWSALCALTRPRKEVAS
jgi:hypothetical protein